MADVTVANYALQSTSHQFSAVWEVTRAMKAAGYTYLASSDGTTKETTGIATNDKWGGNANPLLDTYPVALDAAAAWWLAQGPTVLKVSMTVAPTGSFIRGEKVTQATSGAEGEFLGYDFDGVSVGHAVIMPHTGTFDNTHIITGAVSAATFTSTGVDNFVMQVVFWKTTNTAAGSMYIQRCSTSTESASQFSTLVSAAGCTATVAPAGGGTANAFPTAGSTVGIGTNTGSVTHSSWLNSATSTYGKAQIFVANCTPVTNVSADGTFNIMVGDTNGGVGTGVNFWGYNRLDDTEDADLDPYILYRVTNRLFNAGTSRVDDNGGGAWTLTGGAPGIINSQVYWKGWRRRGFPTNDAYNAYVPCLLTGANSASSTVIGDNISNPETVACSYTTKKLRERIWLVSQDNTKKHRKGTLRWIWVAQGGVAFDTLDSKLKVAIASNSGSVNSIFLNVTLYFGKYDGSSVPTQT